MNKQFALFSLFFMFLATINTFGDVPELIRAADDGNLDKVRELIAAGADVNAVAIDDEYYVDGLTALYVAGGNPEIVRVLLEAGAHPNGGHNDYGAPIIAAVESHSLESVWLLVEADADIHAKGWITSAYGPREIEAIGLAGYYNYIDLGLNYDYPEIIRFLIDRGALTAVLNDSDVRVRDRSTTEGSNTIGMLQKGQEVTVLGRSESTAPIGGMSDYWLKIRLKDGTTGFSYGAFYDLNSLWKDGIPVFQEAHTDPPWRVGETFRANFEQGRYGTNTEKSTLEEIRILSENGVQFSSELSYFDGTYVTTENGTWSKQGNWIMLRLRRTEYADEGGEIYIDHTLFLEWRPDLGGFLKSEDATKIEQGKFKLNREKQWFESDTESDFEHIGYFTWVYSR